jgi:hypothetical protein
VKLCWINRSIFELIDGIVYKKRTDTVDTDLVIPASLKNSAIESSHDLPSAGHQGIARTKARVREKFWWYGLGLDVANYVLTCAVCNQNKKKGRYGRCPLTEYQAGAPMERIHIDFLGPLPKTPRDNLHILMIVDQFTKWVECIPVQSQSAEVTAKAAVDGMFSRFGCPYEIHSDQGRNFESKLFAALCEVLHIHKTRTTAYRPPSNGQVERYNRTLMDAVRCFVDKSQNQWDLYLHQISGALRSSVNRMTGFSANQLMLGRDVTTPAHLMFPHPTGPAMEPDAYYAELTSKMLDAHQIARSKLKTSTRSMKRNYDLRILDRPYKVGDFVYLLDTAVIKGKCKKLCSPWKGPAVITKMFSSYIYRIKLQNAVMVVNHDRKLPCWLLKWKEDPSASDEPSTDDGTLYCLCRKPCQGRFMIQCDFCDEWFHGACVNVTYTDALNINRYKCAKCKDVSRKQRGQ